MLKFITCGSVDDGKSTLIGHILYDSKLLFTDQEQALILDSQVGNRRGEIDYSLLLDGLMAEREQGITIDVAYRYFTTDARSFIVADTPGHEEYTRNMAVGASFADLAVILVDASQGVLTQTCRHARICALMGIKYFVFAVNKMDLVSYSEERFRAVSVDIKTLSEKLGLENILAIPVSATEGDNVTTLSAHMTWYKGPTLLGFLESVDISGASPEEGFYMPVQRVCRPDHTFRGFQGEIESGNLNVGDTLTALPSGETALVKSIYIADKDVESASTGQPVTIQLDREVDVSRGCVLTRNANLKTGKTFFAVLLWMDDQKLIPGKDYWVKIGTKLLTAIVTEIRHKVDIESGELLTADSIGKNEIALCELALSESAVLDEFRLHKSMGELILIDRVSHATSACGVINSVGKQDGTGVYLSDGEHSLQVLIFDSFYYHPDIHAILRHRSNPAVYQPGDVLPLTGTVHTYPGDFDIPTDFSADLGFANIRNGVFTGFGGRNTNCALIDTRGLDLDVNPPRDFTKYRKISVWENDYEI